ncbi:hypothetical protein niasHT_017292 [Heterodera trifolii]|uniref:Uncharacterized protein n=1 Tax=Heterodera trifolii TaxID=157864 RepID=A0ABD2LGS7_9BILA
MSASSAAFFLLTLALLALTANTLRCFQGSDTDSYSAYAEVECPSRSSDGCAKMACYAPTVGKQRLKGCLKNKSFCGKTMFLPEAEGECEIHCCTGNMCNGVLAMQPIAIGCRAVLVPLIISILAAAFGILF